MFLYLNRIHFRNSYLSNNANLLVCLNKKIHSSSLLSNSDEKNQDHIENNQKQAQKSENLNTKKKKLLKFQFIAMDKSVNRFEEHKTQQKPDFKIEVKYEIKDKPIPVQEKELVTDVKKDFKPESQVFKTEMNSKKVEHKIENTNLIKPEIESKEIKQKPKDPVSIKPDIRQTKTPVKTSSYEELFSKLLGNSKFNSKDLYQKPKMTNPVKQEVKPDRTYDEQLAKFSDDKITLKLARLIDRNNPEKAMEALRNPIEKISNLPKEKAPEIPKKQNTYANDLKLYD